MTVAELRTTMSVYEYNQWATYYIWEQDEQAKQYALAEAEAKKRNR
jgi:hypothetical protein